MENINRKEAAVLNRKLAPLLLAMQLIERPKPSRAPKLPDGLCHDVARQHAKALERASRVFGRRLTKGQRVFFVTIIRPDWIVPGGSLSRDTIKLAKEWTARRLRRLAVHGAQRGLGVVDMNWDDRRKTSGPSHWCVHVHLIVSVRAPHSYKVEKLLHDVFNTESDAAAEVKRPIQVKAIPTAEDLDRVLGYVARKFRVDAIARRESLTGGVSRRTSRDRPLHRAQMQELVTVLAQLRPQQRTVVSGFVWRGRRMRLREPTVTVKRSLRYMRGIFE